MGHGLGRDPIQTGTVPTPAELPVLQGTSPADMRRVLGSLFHTNGILPTGGGQATGTSSMAYAVTPGAAVFWTTGGGPGERAAMVVPFEATTVQTDPAPATGSRTDTVYVDADGAVRVAIGTEPPAGNIHLAMFDVPAGITATTAASRRLNRVYTTLAGASMGRLAQWVDPGGGPAGTAEVVRHQSQFYLPSDRMLRVDLSLTIRSATATEGSMQVGLELVNGGTSWLRWVNVRHLPGAWDTRTAVLSTVMPVGLTTFKVRTRVASGGTYEIAGGSTTPSEAAVWDAGVAR